MLPYMALRRYYCHESAEGRRHYDYVAAMLPGALPLARYAMRAGGVAISDMRLRVIGDGDYALYKAADISAEGATRLLLMPGYAADYAITLHETYVAILARRYYS